MSPELVPPVPLLPRHRSVDRAFPPPLTLFGGAHEGGSWDMGALELGPGGGPDRRLGFLAADAPSKSIAIELEKLVATQFRAAASED